MRFSVLLPTKNGAKFLRNCIISVLEQDYHDMELVVSDNASTDETPSIVKEFSGDPRLKYVRLDEPVPVTDNWNNALRASRGDYILQIGDDDALLPGYFERMERALTIHGYPDCISYYGYLFVFPGGLENSEAGLYKEFTYKTGAGCAGTGLISEESRLRAVRELFRFNLGFGAVSLNLQLTLFSREMAGRLPAGVFRPPFPDHYAVLAMALKAKRWAFSPEKLVAVGISPKSFGHSYFGGQQEIGASYLGLESGFKGQLQGNVMINSMYRVFLLLKEDFPEELELVDINNGAYLGQSIFAWYQDWRAKRITFGEAARRFIKAPVSYWFSLLLFLFNKENFMRIVRTLLNKEPLFLGGLKRAEASNIREFAEWISNRSFQSL